LKVKILKNRGRDLEASLDELRNASPMPTFAVFPVTRQKMVHHSADQTLQRHEDKGVTGTQTHGPTPLRATPNGGEHARIQS